MRREAAHPGRIIVISDRVEHLADLTKRDEAILERDLLQLVGYEPEPTVDVAVLPREGSRIQHRHEVGQHGLDTELSGQVTVAVDPPLVVDVFGLQPLQIGGALCDESLKLAFPIGEGLRLSPFGSRGLGLNTLG